MKESINSKLKIPFLKKKYSLFSYISLFIVLLIPLLIFLVQQNRQYLIFAQQSHTLQPELGTFSGNVTIVDDATVSGGKYVKLTNSPFVFQPSAPYYATFFYIWYKNPNTDTNWSYWNDLGNTPPNTWFSHYIPDPQPTIFDPSNELYSANNYTTFQWQVSKLAEAKQEVAIASWWGQGTKEDLALNTILNDFMLRTDNPYPKLRWTMYYEDEGFGDPDVATLVSDLTHIKNTFAESPYYFKINGKPVIFVYGNANDEPGTLLQRWHDANTQLGDYFYYVLKVFSSYSTATPQPNSWHQYAPANRSGSNGTDSFFVSPGFWLDDGVSPVRLQRSLTEFQTAVTNMVQAQTQWKLVQTWNEWGEGTSVEPGQQTIIDGTGKEVLDPNGTPFGNQYIDILNATLPALEAGTGVL